MKNPNDVSCRRRGHTKVTATEAGWSQKAAQRGRKRCRENRSVSRTSPGPRTERTGRCSVVPSPRGPDILQVLGKSRIQSLEEEWSRTGSTMLVFYHVWDILENILHASWRCWFRICNLPTLAAPVAGLMRPSLVSQCLTDKLG